jgi:hypothetical protein
MDETLDLDNDDDILSNIHILCVNLESMFIDDDSKRGEL